MQWVSRNLLLCRCQSISSSSASSTSSSGSEHGSRHGVVRCAYLQMEMITPICRKSRSWSSGGGGGAGGVVVTVESALGQPRNSLSNGNSVVKELGT